MTQAEPARLGKLAQGSFVLFMLMLMGLFILLGTWQLQRLAEKEAQIATVAARINQAPIAFPAPDLWSGLDPEALDYRPVGLVGSFDHANTVLVFVNLTDPKGQYGRTGYWVMAPFRPQEGEGVVWVNRGFVPDHLAGAYTQGGTAPEGTVQIEGIARRPEMANPFTPGPELAARREWVRDPERLTAFLEDYSGPVAPVTIDLPAGEPGELPQGGETQVTFSNRHLEYAGTWYIFAAITPIMLGFWLWRQRAKPNLAQRRARD